jgi:transmembrane sensor
LEDQHLQQLLQKFVEDKATPAEIRLLLSHFHTTSEDELMKLIMAGFAIDQHSAPTVNPDQDVLDRVYNRLDQDIKHAKKEQNRDMPMRRRWNIAAAASIVLALSFGSYSLLHKPNVSEFKNDIAPGHNQATLTLANGQKIILTKHLSGQLAQQGSTLIGVDDKNEIAYTGSGTNSNAADTYNTLSTAVGEQSPYPLVLADGTKVWLDAGSSITFPVAFAGKERSVKITGEAYFEVVHNDAQPFKVVAKDQVIEDIGTHFNVNAYDDEKVITTTLLEGAVKVSVPGASLQAQVMLKPGQKSVLKNNALDVANANIEEAIAWKNGYFRFENEGIQSIMRKLTRWYNIDVQYSGTIPDETFYATSSRYKNISEVLTMLQNTKGVHFKIEGRRVTVMQ